MHKSMLMVVLVAALAVTPALADIVAIGDPLEIGSWGHLFNEKDVGPFDQVEIRWKSGGGLLPGFEAPGFSSFTTSGWNSYYLSATHVVAQGTSTSNMNFMISFLGSASETAVFDFDAWNGNKLAEGATASWNGSSWSFAHAPGYTRTAVPEGFTWPLMSASSLIALAGLARRRAAGC